MVLIHAFLGAGNVQGAVELYKSMQRQGYDMRAGWLMLTSELFRHGCATAGGKFSREMRLHVWVVFMGCLQKLAYHGRVLTSTLLTSELFRHGCVTAEGR